MRDGELRVSVRERGVRVGVIAIAGEVTGASEARLMAAYAEANAQQPRAVVLDFTDMGYMNSSGIGLLVTLLIRANRQGQHIFAVGLNEHYRQIFALTRLDQAIRVCGSEAEARAEIG